MPENLKKREEIVGVGKQEDKGVKEGDCPESW